MTERSFEKEVEKLRLGAGEEFRGEGILAVTKALLQSGVSYVAGYQGAPISHLMDVLADAEGILDELGVHFEASANEAAAAATLAASVNYPLRGAVTWKSTAGTNVASDALSNLSSGGVTGGALIVIGEDYGEGSSIMQERTHAFAMKSQIWLLDPRPNLPAIVTMVEKGFELSEATNTPVMLELRIRACHVLAIAEANGAHLSAALLGAVAGSGALPIPRDAYEAAIRHAGVGVAASLRAFAAGLSAAASPAALAVPPAAPPRSREAEAIIAEGVRRLTDYQDAAYAELYRQRLDRLPIVGVLLAETARHLALWMSYEDTIRVADLKTRASRFARVREEMRARPDQIVRISEFMHPRVQEIADTLPAPLGRWLLRSGLPRRLLERVTARGRHVETTSVGGFLLLRGIASLGRFRRGTLRFQEEQARIEAWLARIGALAARDAALALQVARCQRLVKGYGDTHARGWANFQRLMTAADGLAGDSGAAARLAALCDAALADDTGQALTEARAA